MASLRLLLLCAVFTGIDATAPDQNANLGGGPIRTSVSATGDVAAADGVEAAASGASSEPATTPPPSEPVNPYQSDGDTTDECYAWAADGQCTLNPSFMLSSCKYSCWEWYSHRRQKYPSAPIDKHFECYSWSNAGECHKNRDFMEPACPESCKDRYEPPNDPPPVPAHSKAKKKKKKSKAKTTA